MTQASTQQARVPGPGDRRAGRGRGDETPNRGTSAATRSGPFRGSQEAAALCTAAASDPSAPLLALITGPGGCGKTAVLDTLAQIYRGAGLEVHREPGRWPPPASAAVLIDDARRLDADRLMDLQQLVTAGAPRVIVATRPGPPLPELDALGAALGRHRAPIVLGRLDRAEVAARMEAACDGPCAPAAIAFVHDQTSGIPRLVDALITALRERGALGPQPAAAGWVAPSIPTGVLELLRLELAALGPDTVNLLLALAVGADLDPALLAETLGTTAAAIEHAAELARGSGLLADNGAPVPLARDALLALAPPTRVQAIRVAWAGAIRRRGGPMVGHAQSLAATDLSGPDVADVLAAGADEAQSPAEAVKLYAAAVKAGAPVHTVAGRLARASALSGDLDTALRLADAAISDPQAADRDVAVDVAATVLATRGMLARSAQLYRWFAANGAGHTTVAVPALLGTGDLAAARAALAPGGDRPPTLTDGVETLVAEGVLETVLGTPSAALSKLTRAALLLEPTAHQTLLPDTPAALAAVVAITCGEFDVAESTLARAVHVRLGGEPAMSRYHLLQAWTAMQRGDLDSARSLLATTGPGGRALEPREELTAAAISVGLARREGDLGALGAAWQRARQAIVRHPVDLYALHALGELTVAAARLKEQPWIAPHLTEAWDLLTRLGEPALWAAPLHWYAVQAASLADRRAEADAHISTLEAAAAGYAQAGVLATAARCWMRVMAGDVDPNEVQLTAKRLHGIGLGWDASRLAGQAAVRTGDRAAMSALMSCARSLRPAAAAGDITAAPAESEHPAPPARPAATSRTGPDGNHPLSDREREVATLLLTGLTYREIGERLFISAKTVEHHVARMRQRIGAGSRGDLFARLRTILDGAG